MRALSPARALARCVCACTFGFLALTAPTAAAQTAARPASAKAKSSAKPPAKSSAKRSARSTTRSLPRPGARKPVTPSGSRAITRLAGRTPARETAAGIAALPSMPTVPAIDLAALAATADFGAPAVVPAAAVGSVAPERSALPATAALAELTGPLDALTRSAGGMLEALFARARSQLGTRYVLGADRPGGALDCSSFTRFAMEALGIDLPRTAAQQARVGTPVPRDRSRLRPGDLLTFGTRRKVSHVGIYLGEGRFIHASVTSGRVIETTFERNGRLLRQWLGARRVIADVDGAVAPAATATTPRGIGDG